MNALLPIPPTPSAEDKAIPEFAFVLYAHERNPYPTHIDVSSGWPGLKKHFSKHTIRNHKSGPAFAPVLTGDNSKRCNEHTEYIYALVIDSDAGLAKEEALERVAPFEHVAYSTHSNTPEKSKYRIVILLKRPVHKIDWPMAWAGARAMFGDDLMDTKCGDVARLYFLPSCPPEQEERAWIIHHEGQRLDPDELITLGRQHSQTPSVVHLNAGPSVNQASASAVAPDDDLLAHYRPGFTFPTLVRDGDGRESKLLAAAGFLRSQGLSQPVIEATLLAYNENHIIPPLPVTTVLDRARRYATTSSMAMPTLSPQSLLQQRFALIREGPHLMGVDLQELHACRLRPEPFTPPIIALDALRMLAARAIAGAFPNPDPRVIRQFIESPETTVFDGVTFDPTERTPYRLNLWIPPAIAPEKGPCSVILDFLLQVICAGDEELCHYLLGYLAHAFQRPEEKPGIILVLVGGQGVGKGTLLSLIRAIWPHTTRQTSNVDDVVGDFNQLLETAMFILLDEALFPHDRKGVSRLKSLATEPWLTVNAKYRSPHQIRSIHRLILTTNDLRGIHAEYDDRRTYSIECSPIRKGDRAYWNSLYSALKTELPAFVHLLATFDLTGFEVRTKPNTRRLLQQKVNSLDGTERWWFEALTRGWFDPSHDYWPEVVASHDLYESALNFLVGTRQYQKLTTDEVIATVKRLCPLAEKCDIGPADEKKRRRGWRLPPLDTCRGLFEQRLGGTLDWD